MCRQGYKETEIGCIPEDWKVVRLGDVVEVVNGTTPSTKNKKYWENGTIEWVTPADMSDSNIYISGGRKRITQEALKGTGLKLIPVGSILVSTRAPIGYVQIVAKDLTHNQGCKALIPKQLITSMFLLYVLRFFRKNMESLGNGSTFKEISSSSLKSLLLPLPPLPEQKKIAEILSTVDEEIETVDKEIERAEKMRRGLLSKLLTEGIGHTEFKETEIGRIPKNWQVVKLGDVVKKMYYGITAKASDWGQYRFIRTTDVTQNAVVYDNLPYAEITEKVKDIDKYFVNTGDILVSRAGTIGVMFLVKEQWENVLFGSYMIKLQLSEKLIPEFVYYWGNSNYYWQQLAGGGSTIQNINLPLLKSLLLPLPPLPEQKKIAEILSTVDEYIQTLREKKKHLEQVKKGLLNDLITGKRRVKVDAVSNI